MRQRLRRAWTTAAAVVLIAAATTISSVAVLATAYLYTQEGSPALWVDWQTYSLAVDRYLSDENLYAAAQVAGRYELPDMVLSGYIYPPPSILLLAPFAGSGLGLLAWLLLNALVLVLGMSRVLGVALGMRPLSAVAASCTVLAIMPPFLDGMASGNVNVGLAGLLALTWVSGPHPSTLAIGLAGGVLKAFPGVLAVLYCHRSARRLSVTAIAGMGVLALSVAVQGSEVWVNFIASLRNAVPACDRAPVSVACALAPSLGISAAQAVAVGASVTLIATAFACPWREVRFILVTLGMLAPVAELWPHYGLYWLVVLWVLATGIAARYQAIRQRSGLALEPLP